MEQNKQNSGGSKATAAGLGGWVLERLRGSGRPRPRLALIERIALAPKQSLALVEAEGRRFLVATSTEGSPVFYPLDAKSLSGDSIRYARSSPVHSARVSW
jgi:hypothetical protein